MADADAESPDATNVMSVPGVRRVFFELGDHLGSMGTVLDKASSELVERATYQAYGSTESDYRPERWSSFREDYSFTGKEEDVEVGLVYFGKRFYNPLLQRWVSADPLEVHEIASGEPNVYAYVRGRALQNIDPLGLDDVGVNVSWDEFEASVDAKYEGMSDAELLSADEYGLFNDYSGDGLSDTPGLTSGSAIFCRLASRNPLGWTQMPPGGDRGPRQTGPTGQHLLGGSLSSA